MPSESAGPLQQLREPISSDPAGRSRPLSCEKHLFSLAPGTHYLNCAYMSPLSKRVEQVGVEAMRRKRMPSDIRPEDFFRGPNRVRALFAELVHIADPQRVAVVPSVSYGLGVVARNLNLSPSQNVVTVHHQFPSNMYPWRRLCHERGASLRVVAPPAGPGRAEAWNEAIYDAIDGDTALVALGNVHWADGTRFDLDRIGRRARDVGAVFAVDGTQSVGAAPFDVAQLQPDVLVCAAYKWLMGPYSIGAAYFGPRFDAGIPLEETWMARSGSEEFGGLVNYVDDYRDGAGRYDVGEASNFILIPMFIAALQQVLHRGVGRIATYCRSLVEDLIAQLRADGFRIEETQWRWSHLFGIRPPPGTDLHHVHDRLVTRNISASIRGDVIRVSPNVYNDEGDVEALRQALSPRG